MYCANSLSRPVTFARYAFIFALRNIALGGYLDTQGCARDGRRWSALAATLKLPTATVLRRPPVGLGLTLLPRGSY